ncbi:MAG TPA: topoisomerase IV [Firmicutes bacterium]|nr:topoisomerase IV [Bacillota bacterium]
MATTNLVGQKIIDTLEQNYMPYAMSVIVSRAIPEIDGFKPSHRKLLYTMYKMGLLTGGRTKSANIVGQTMKLNPHGDMAIYETMVRLTRGYDALLLPFIDSKGNFGKQYSRDMHFAAPRYTEAKLDKICDEIFKDLDKDTVEFTDNYDGTLKEPTLLPTTFPNILVNSNQGIAVGMASNICSFNLREVCETAIEYLKNPEADLLKSLKAPDLASGGQLIFNERDIREIYETGRGGFKVRAKYRFDAKNNCLEIYQIPFTTTSEAIIDAVIDLVKNGKIKEISDVRDETDLNGLKVTLDLRKNADPEGLMNKLFKLTPLQESFNCNFNILIHGKPRVLGVRDILKEWADFRIDCIKRQIVFDIQKKSEKLHLLEGLAKILLDIDKAIRIIRETELENAVIPNLIKGFSIDQVQAEFIAEIKLRNLNKEYIVNRIAEIAGLQKEIAGLQDLHSHEEKIKALICRELMEVAKKYGAPRRTEIIGEENITEVTVEHLIDDYNLKIFLTEQNYLKKITLASLRANPEHKLKEEDRIIQEIETHNKADLLLFSNKHCVYKLKIYDINDCKASTLGEYLTNLLELEPEEKIIYVVATDNYQGNLLFAYENGKIAKVDLAGYVTKTNRRRLANAYSDLSPLVMMKYLEQDLELVAYSSINKVLIFNSAAVSAKTTRDSQGIQVLISKKASRMVELKPLSEVSLGDPNYYRTKNIPAIGCYLKEEDRQIEQGSLGLEVSPKKE